MQTHPSMASDTEPEKRIIRFHIPCLPLSVNHSHLMVSGNRRRRILRKEAKQFMQEVKAIMMHLRVQPLKGRLGVRYTFYVLNRRTDLFNREKLLSDSLQADREDRLYSIKSGYCFANDSQIDDGHVRRIVGQGEGVDVEVWEL